MIRLWHRQWIVLAVPVLLFFLLELQNLSLSERHYLVFPIVLVAVPYVFLMQKKWIVVALLTSLPVMFFGVRFVFSLSVGPESRGVLLSQLENDSSEAHLLQLREQITRFSSERVKNSLLRYFRVVRSEAELRDIFPHASAVIWGNKEQIRVSFEKKKPPLKHYRLQSSNQAMELAVVENIQGVELSIKPVQQTGLFIARILEILLLEKDSENEKELKALLMKTSNHISHWDARSHLAFPWLKLSNIRLKEGYELQKKGSWKRALQGYTQAAAYLEPYAHPELRAAIFNNKAVALLLSQTPSNGDERLQQAQLLLQKARVIAGRPGLWSPPKYLKRAIRKNLRIVDALSGNSKKYRRRKHGLRQGDRQSV